MTVAFLMSTRRPNPPSVYVLSKLFVCALVVVVVPSNLKTIALVAMSKSESSVERYGEPRDFNDVVVAWSEAMND